LHKLVTPPLDTLSCLSYNCALRITKILIHQVHCLTNKEYTMSKNTSANPPEKEVRQQGQNKPEITELSFEAMETISGGAAKHLSSL
jgi:hypothetical protein